MKYSTKSAVQLVMVGSSLWLGACSDSGGSSRTMNPAIMGLAGAGFSVGTAGSGDPGAAGVSPNFGAAGTLGAAGDGAIAGMDGLGGVAGVGGAAGDAALAGAGSVAGDGAGGMDGLPGTPGDCCADGDCLCHGPAPTALTSSKGTYATGMYTVSTGTVHYPTDGEPPFAAVAVCGGFTNTGPEMAPWGPFYASHGIVTIITTTTGADTPDIRATKLLAAIAELKAENTKSGSPLFGKLSGRYGTSGYSMGGGGTTIATGTDSTLKTSVGLAPWGPVGTGVTTPTLLLCGGSDTTAPCNMAQGAYTNITADKMMISINGVTHFNWFDPADGGMGTSGKYALAFQKVYLEGDERWKSLLLSMPSNGTMTTTIK